MLLFSFAVMIVFDSFSTFCWLLAMIMLFPRQIVAAPSTNAMIRTAGLRAASTASTCVLSNTFPAAYCLVLFKLDAPEKLTLPTTSLQESTKTKHPQLFYEAKLYNTLQGGSMCCVIPLCISFLLKIRHHEQLTVEMFWNPGGIANVKWCGVDGEENVLVIDLLCWDQVWRTSLSIAAGNSHSRLS